VLTLFVMDSCGVESVVLAVGGIPRPDALWQQQGNANAVALNAKPIVESFLTPVPHDGPGAPTQATPNPIAVAANAMFSVAALTSIIQVGETSGMPHTTTTTGACSRYYNAQCLRQILFISLSRMTTKCHVGDQGGWERTSPSPRRLNLLLTYIFVGELANRSSLAY